MRLCALALVLLVILWGWWDRPGRNPYVVNRVLRVVVLGLLVALMGVSLKAVAWHTELVVMNRLR